MAKRSSPALYELIRHRGGERVAPSASHAAPSDEGGTMPAPLTWLQPGRSVQMPVGYLFVAMAVVIGVVALTYILGYHRGEESARYVLEEELGIVGSADRNGQHLRDPLVRLDGAGAARSGGAAVAGPSSTTSNRATEASWGAIDSDPRVAGQMYFILAQTTVAGATRLAEFCREHGLETYVVSGNNARLRRVIALPGLDPERPTAPEVRQMRERIHAIGKRWEQERLGTWNYHEAYPSRYGR